MHHLQQHIHKDITKINQIKDKDSTVNKTEYRSKTLTVFIPLYSNIAKLLSIH